MKLLYLNIFLFLVFTMSSADEKFGSFEDAKLYHENDYPVFSQKGGMLRPGDHSFYIRTNDEWTGFSTFLAGYRYGITDFFNIALEGGASPIPHVYIAALILHFKLYETPNKFFFLGLRTRFGYRYQDSDFSKDGWTNVVGQDYLTLKRNGLYFAPDLTVAFRVGKYKELSLYYTVYPRFDFDFEDKENPIYILFSPVMTGMEIRFGKRMRWSFAVEAGYTFPIPWNSIPQGKWVNFPSLANLGLYYRFGNNIY